MNINNTIIEFIFLPRNWNYSNLKVELKFLKLHIGAYYYNELFIIYSKEDNNVLNYFKFEIYFGITNHIIYDLDEKNKSSFELIFYSKEFNLLPKSILYKSNILNNFESNGNLLRKRICLANVIIDKLQYINDSQFKEFKNKFENDTYQLLIRIANNKDLKYSLSEKKTFLLNNNKIKVKKTLFVKVEDINLLNEFYENYNNLSKSRV